MRATKAAARSSVAAVVFACQPALAVDVMESIGAVKCGGAVKSYAVEFLAPESTALEATSRVMVNGAPDVTPESVILSLDGKACSNARCSFQAKKGETYKLSAVSRAPKTEDLCIVVARP